MKHSPRIIQIGNTAIHATNQDFIQGFEAGNLAFQANQEPYTDEEVMQLILDKLEDLNCSTSFGLGFSVGWLNALARDGGKA